MNQCLLSLYVVLLLSGLIKARGICQVAIQFLFVVFYQVTVVACWCKFLATVTLFKIILWLNFAVAVLAKTGLKSAVLSLLIKFGKSLLQTTVFAL